MIRITQNTRVDGANTVEERVARHGGSLTGILYTCANGEKDPGKAAQPGFVSLGKQTSGTTGLAASRQPTQAVPALISFVQARNRIQESSK
jgi:hypothetical protein